MSRLTPGGRAHALLSLMLLIGPLHGAQTPDPKTPIDPPRPVTRRPGNAPRVEDIEFARFEFQRPAFGREGATFVHIEGEPSTGARYIVEARLYGDEAIATARFDLVDNRGTWIQLVPMTRTANASGGSEFVGLLSVPPVPFRVMVSGQGIDGTTYRQMHEGVFRPTSRPPAGPLTPPGIPPASANRLVRLVEEARRQAEAKIEEDLKKYPDGVIVLPRSDVSNVTYAPLLSKQGDPLGVRVSYDVEFSDDGYYNPELRVSPDYENPDWRGVVGMQVIESSIRPLPAEAGAPQERPNILAYGAGFVYRGNTAYHFVAEMVPDYVIQNEAKTKFCIYTQKFKYSPRSRSAWNGILESEASTTYSVTINNTEFHGEIAGLHAQRTIHRSFIAGGAGDCGEQPTKRF
jgi:hypothetical protein